MSSSSQAAETWIAAFCNHIGHEYFAEVSEDFIEDDFNLTGLQSQVPMYKEALEMILDVEPDDDGSLEDELDDDEHSGSSDASMRDYRRSNRQLRMSEDASVIESSADLLYGLIHQRYITSRPGMQQMQEKYDMGHFGACPRVYCRGAKVLPVGCSDIPGQETVKLFCPACLDVYTPPNSRFQNVDGAFFGTTFGCLFFMTFPDFDVAGARPLDVEPPEPKHGMQMCSPPFPPYFPPKTPMRVQPKIINGVAAQNLAPGLSDSAIYEPRIYGFKLSAMAKTGPRMKWLRRKPMDLHFLDETTRMKKHFAAVAESRRKREAAQEAAKNGSNAVLPEKVAKKLDDDEEDDEDEDEIEEDGEAKEPQAVEQQVDELDDVVGQQVDELDDVVGQQVAEAAHVPGLEDTKPPRSQDVVADKAAAGRKKGKARNMSTNGDSGGAAV